MYELLPTELKYIHAGKTHKGSSYQYFLYLWKDLGSVIMGQRFKQNRYERFSNEFRASYK